MVGEKKIPKGYKQTEVGVVPEEWGVRQLKEITILMTNGFVGTIKTQYSESNDSVLYIQGYNVKENGFNLRGVKRINKAFHIAHSKSSLKQGDLLTIQTGDIGVSAVVPKEYEGSNCQALIITRMLQEAAESHFFCYYFNHSIGRNHLKQIETGSTMKHINVGDMKNLIIPLPPLPEQKAIAEVLSDTDALIESLETLLAKKRAVKQGSMQELLTGRRRLPGFAVSGRYRQTEVGVVPEEWEVVFIGTCATVIGGGTPSTTNSQFWDGQINWFTPSEVVKAKYLRESIRKISLLGLNNSSAKPLPPGTILLTTRATIGETGILLNAASTNQGFQSLIPVKDKTDTEFFYYLLNTIKPKLLSLSSGSTFLELNPTKLRSILIPLPPLPEQKAIAEVLSDMDAEIETLEKKRDKYKKIKKGMMAQLLTGKVRLIRAGSITG